MKISKFINYNELCPCCGNKLNLFMATNLNSNPILWKGKVFEKHLEFTRKDDPKEKFNIIETQDDHILEKYSTFTKHLWVHNFWFFYICNPKAIKIKDIPYDFEIAAFESCYYRASPLMQCINISTRKIEIVNLDEENYENLEQTYSVKYDTESETKAYLLSLDYKENKSKLWYCRYPIESFKKDNAKTFEIEMPLIKNVPNFLPEHRDKLIEKFQSWILMS